jgi:hypothetical protein
MNNLFLIIVLLSFSLLIIGFISPKTSLFWYKKERTRKKSFFIYLSSMISFYVLFGITIEENELEKYKHQSNDPLSITRDSVKSLVGKNVPFSKWEEWGFPKTLDGTDGKYWVVYLDSANVSFISDKNTDKVLFADFDSISSINQLKIIKEQRKKNIEKLFSQWDGSHIELTKKIKESLNDPNSYEHIETKYRDMGSTLTVYKTFTAKNSFGGRLKRQVIVVSDMQGNITEVIKWIN